MSAHKNKIRIAIVDDHQLFIEGIKALINDIESFVLVGQAGNGAQLLELLKTTEADVVLMDVYMPGMDGIEATHKVKSKYPNVKILALSMVEDAKHISDMLKAGALGYLLKSTGKQELIEAIKTVYAGERYLNQEVSMKLVELVLKAKNEPQQAPSDRNPSITKREHEIIRLIGQEMTNEEIARELNNSPMTITTHRKNILRKLNLKNTAGMVRYGVQHGFIV
ncbi:MAG TPA: response regulator transcription factor [Chitinophagales bacterium]|nr:response regulator transcription factor [Chitinophagales bacterium]